MAQYFLANGGNSDTAVGAFKDDDAELVFQFLDLPIQSRLTDEAALCGLASVGRLYKAGETG